MGVSVLIFGINLIQSFLLFKNTELTTIDKIAYGLQGGSYLLVSVGYFLYYRRLKKNSDHHDEDQITIVAEEPPQQSNIYDDFGF